MYLKSIEVNGFKSFAHKMIFKFEHGITGIVGPNGSGKSNVADAVRWVLGEQRAKQLRGSKMEDVIFAGTELRKPMGSAYVAITLDNSDHSLPIQFEEVTVARRVYRSGESEYLINGSACRRKDIVELFFDTGIGKEGYSIIGQGQIEQILSGKPEERRELFDEAAGIVKYKKNKLETQKSLEIERENLVRVTDILTELERQVGPLKKQSEHAREYLLLRDQLKDEDVKLFLLENQNLEKELKELDEKIEIAQREINEANQTLAKAKEKYGKQEEFLDHLKQEIETITAHISEMKLTKQKKEGKIQVLNEQINTEHMRESMYLESKDKLYKDLNEKKAQLNASQAQLDDGKRQIEDAKQKLEDGQKQIEDAKATIAKNEKKLAKGERKYEKKKEKAEKKIAKAEKKIDDAQKEVDDIKEPEWTVEDRSDLLEYTNYGDNAERMKSIGEVFPVLFFLVAALISLTTMTRMVEEERTQIGTMKALGYSKVDIAAKYLLYALFATVGGSVLGVLAGEKILPYIIIRSYGIMYLHMNTICIPYNMKFALIAAGAAIFCTMIATLEACIRELHAWPAVLMRPPAPKQGRRVWIEKIPFLWKHLSFTWKSTVRNLFRYKKRFFMTIIGIGGCMGLLLVGFGLRDSIMDVAILQYQDIQVYDGMIVLDADADQSGQDELKQELADDGSVEAFAEVSMKKVEFASADKKLDVYLMVVPDDVSIDEFVKFRSRTTKEAYELDDQGMILTEKAGKLLGVSAGDSVEMTGEHSGVKIPINRICENYMSHFAYMTENMYRKLYGEKPQYNSILYRVTDRDESIAEKAGERAMKCDAALSVTYTGNTKEQLDNMLTALDSVIGVLILSAGMLAFVVLYNLNNININERKRELATIKVLGFYDKEVSAYVYRENILLTILGSIFGIFLGILLHRFIIVTVEVDVCMFGRNISVFSYVISALITYGFSILVNGVMYFKLKKIDMVESLKSVE